jgi:hypothetical protein
MDFAFGFPSWWARQQRWGSGREVWKAMAEDGEDLLVRCEPPFWGRPGRKNPNAVEAGYRATDLDASGGSSAKSVFQIGGAGAVGTGSVRGMAQLHRLSDEGFAVWPFDDDDGRSVAIEIYPRRLTKAVVKSSWKARRSYLLSNCAEQPTTMLERAAGSEDAFDAAVSAIVMARHRDQLASLPSADGDARLEGRIWSPA